MLRALVIAIGLGFGLGGGSDAAGVSSTAPPGPAADAAAAGIVAAANRFRAEQGLGALAPESRLTAAAAGFAGYMARTDRYAHDADGRQPHERVAAQRYDWCAVLENIAWVQSSAPLPTGALVQRFI